MNEIGDKLNDLKIERPPGRERSAVWIPATIVGALLLALVGWWAMRPGAAEVVTAVAREVSVGAEQTVLNASGYVTARRQATVSSKVTGKVVEVLIEEGLEVEEGQVLARLDDVNARATLELMEAQAAAARRDVEETAVRLEEARLELERAKNLLANQVASQAELDRAQADVDSLAARLVSQEAAATVAERQVAVAEQALDDLTIRAPFAGVVVAKNAQPGEMISPTSAGGGFTRTGIGTIVDMASLEIEVDVNEAYINRVETGQRVEATLDSYPDWRIPTRVIAIIPTADRQTATVQVRIGFDELDPRILPDMGVKVAFRGGGGEGAVSRAVSVPRPAVRSDGGADVVYVVENGTVERRAVRLGEVTDAEAYVSSGLVAGERVVLEGPAALRDGDRVEEAG